MTHDSALIIRIDFRQEAEYFYAESPDLLGLHICGISAEQTCLTMIKAVKALFKHNRNMDVEVLPATTDGERFPELTGPCEQFVVHRLTA